MLERLSQGRMITWSLEQVGQVMGSPGAVAAVAPERSGSQNLCTTIVVPSQSSIRLSSQASSPKAPNPLENTATSNPQWEAVLAISDILCSWRL